MSVAQNQRPNLHNKMAHRAAELGDYRLLLANLDRYPDHVNARNDAKDTPLHLAATRGHLDCVQLLIERGAKVGHEEINGWTPLICACNTGQIDVVKYLLDHRAGIRHTCELGWNVLHFAAFGGYLELVELLLKRGAEVDINRQNHDCDTPLDLALYKGHDKIAELLKANGGKKAYPDPE